MSLGIPVEKFFGKAAFQALYKNNPKWQWVIVMSEDDITKLCKDNSVTHIRIITRHKIFELDMTDIKPEIK